MDTYLHHGALRLHVEGKSLVRESRSIGKRDEQRIVRPVQGAEHLLHLKYMFYYISECLKIDPDNTRDTDFDALNEAAYLVR